MPYTQSGRMISVTTPLDTDALLLVGLRGREAISELFRFQLDLVSEKPGSVHFDSLLGKAVTATVSLADNSTRHFGGIATRFAQGGKLHIQEGNQTYEFTRYTLELSPKLWLLTRTVRSRIFQQKTVPEILEAALSGLNVDFQIDTLSGTFYPREYCVQYHESDFAFVSRLMEEEGIFYFFKHTESGDQVVVTNNPAKHPELGGTVLYDDTEGGVRTEDRVTAWEKSQEIRSAKVTLHDYHFQAPDSNLEAVKTSLATAPVGQTSHRLQVDQSLELYDFPGEYAKRFDGVNKSGGEQPDKFANIYQDNQRTVGIRMQQETAPALAIQGSGTCRSFTAGSKFTLDNHFSENDVYVLSSVEHELKEPLVTARGEETFQYANTFTCIPFSVPYRPARVTARPRIHGTQTAVVVGPSGDEIFTDPNGRVKVQFHWDREGQNDAESSSWVRVATFWAGKQWGGIHLPRIGQEVVVSFLEGDPDQPIIVGSVYNSNQMPPYTLPDNKTQSGIKSRSSLGGGASNYNEIRFEDKMGSEQILVHAEKDMLTEVENDETRTVGHDRTTTIKNDETKTVEQGNEKITIQTGNQTTTIQTGNQTITIQTGNQTTKVDLGKIETEAMQSIELKVGQSSVKLDQMGVTIKGMMIKIEGQVQVQMKSLMTQVNGDAMLQLKGGITMIN
jgi:type VI secretion system secreted protein VgrG